MFKLFCSKCHTCWTESVWREWQPCPFTDCAGKLSTIAPADIRTQPKARKEPPTYPLFDGA